METHTVAWVHVTIRMEVEVTKGMTDSDIENEAVAGMADLLGTTEKKIWDECPAVAIAEKQTWKD